MGKPTNYEKDVRAFLGTVCKNCDIDEAEGVLIDHCKECCHAIVGMIWQRTFLDKDAPFRSKS